MSIKQHMNRLTDGILDIGLDNKKNEKRGSGELSAPGALAHFSKNYKNLESELARMKAKTAFASMIACDKISTSPYQTRPINENRIAELVANLANNPLSSPISVRKISDDPTRYELIAGHHRLLAFKQLGRDEIPASVIEASDEQAERIVFYDNLIAPTLSDFEKYLGFAQLQKSQKLTLDQMSSESGMSRTLISYMMSFEKLPKSVFDAIAKNPNCVGSNLAQKFASMPDKYSDRIVGAIEKIANGTLLQAQAISWIENKDKPESTKAQVTSIKSGRNKFADVSRKENHLVVKFKNADDARRIEEALIALVKQHAAEPNDKAN